MRLIVTADDFGRSSEINAAVCRAHREGILTAASLMVAGDAFEEAVEIARATPTLAVGLHVVLVDGKPSLPAEKLPLLVDERGRLPNAPTWLGLKMFFDPRARAQAADEIAEQFARFAATGLPLSHVDGHQHLHVHPAIFPLVLYQALAHRAKGIRLPMDDIKLALAYDRGNMPAKVARGFPLAALSMMHRRRLRDLPIAVAERVYGLYQTGRMNEAYVSHLLETSVADTAEIYFHPTTGQRTDDLGPNPDELRTLLSPTLRELIAREGVQLCNYADLRSDGNGNAASFLGGTHQS